MQKYFSHFYLLSSQTASLPQQPIITKLNDFVIAANLIPRCLPHKSVLITLLYFSWRRKHHSFPLQYLKGISCPWWMTVTKKNIF